MKVMKPRTIACACALIAGLAVAAQHPSSGQLFSKAPNFKAATADGKTYELANLNKSGAVYLLFIKEDCPITAEAIGLYNNLYKAYGSKAPVIGILSGDADQFKAYNAKHHLPFPTVLDPKLDIVKSYKVENSPWMIEVRPDGTIGRSWQGYSQDYLQQMNAAVAKSAGVPIAKVNFSDAPKDPAYG